MNSQICPFRRKHQIIAAGIEILQQRITILGLFTNDRMPRLGALINLALSGFCIGEMNPSTNLKEQDYFVMMERTGPSEMQVFA